MQFTLTRALRVLADSLGFSAFRRSAAAATKAVPPSSRARREQARRQNALVTAAHAASAALSTVAARVSNALEPLEGRAMMSATYYVSPTGNDANAGTSQSAPWKSIAKVNAHTLAAGDQVLFQGGKTFAGSVTLRGGGTSGDPAVIGSYGSGQATISSGGGSGVTGAYAVGGVTVENLTLVGNGNGGSGQYGVKFEAYTGSVLPAIAITNCDISGYYASGILVEGDSTHNAFASTTITHNDVHNNVISGIMTYSGHYQMTGVYIGYNTAHDNTGKAGVTGCGNGIELQGLEGAMVEHNVAYHNGIHAVGGDGIWAYGSDHVTFQYNASYDNLTAGGVDGDGFDFDSGMSNSVMQYNYAAGNAGGGYMIDQWVNNSAQTGDVLRFNVAQDNGLKNNYGNIDIWGKDINTQVYNNTIYTTSAGSGPAIRIHNDTITSLYVNGLHVDNNIFVTTGGAAITSVPAAETHGATGLTFDGNVYYSSGAATKIGYGGKTYASLAAFQSGTGQEKVGGKAVGSSANPLLVGGGTAGMSATTGTNLASYLSAYQLQANSPVVSSGVNLKSVLGLTLSGTDMYGHAISAATITPGAATVKGSTVASPTATPTSTPTSTPTATPTSTPTPTKTPTSTPTPTPTSTGTVGSSNLTGWDIGSFGKAGSNSQSGTTETMTASGSDIYGTADSYRYAYTTLTGNGQIIARVASESDANSWAKAGVMIRNATTAANAAEVSLSLTPKGVAQMITRGTAGAVSAVAAQVSDGGDEWVKLVRSGNTFDSYLSGNGTTWTLVGTSTVSMSSSVTVGLAVTAHDDTKLESATFKNVSIT